VYDQMDMCVVVMHNIVKEASNHSSDVANTVT